MADCPLSGSRDMCPLCSFLDEQQQLLSDGVTRVKGRHTRVEEREKTTAPEAMIDPRFYNNCEILTCSLVENFCQ